MSGQLKDIIKWYQKMVDTLQSISLPDRRIEWLIAEVGLLRTQADKDEKKMNSLQKEINHLEYCRRAGW